MKETVFPEDFTEAIKMDLELRVDMVWLQPQWDERDRPRVACPNLPGKTIGGDFCKNECPHLKTTWSNEYREMIGCAFPVIYRHQPIVKNTKIHWKTQAKKIIASHPSDVEKTAKSPSDVGSF